MYILSINMWFQKLMKQFFFGIDQVVYNAISSIYDLLISIARTSIFTQADILDMADRIYKLLAIFMIFKVTLSLITYVVNPDDFSDKSKGISKLSMNIVISLGLLILTPYIFNLAFRLQTIILEDNTMATLIFGEDEDTGGNFINTAGDHMAFITMSAFFTPNTSISELQNCIELTGSDGKVNPACSGLRNDNYDKDESQGSNTMYAVANDDSQTFLIKDLQNYVAGVNNKNIGLMFRQEMAIATNPGNDTFIMDYKYIFSTVVGVVVALLLISFCMDVALRSIKLGFLQLIAPIPILSYVDPKSGKDGMFKKWYQLCFKTYLSLFIRLLALYFAIYIIEKVSDMKLVDVVDGSYVTNAYIYIFTIIGALMFAKDLPKILEGLGIKLDGGGKFTLNPLRKMENQMAGGKFLKKPNDALGKFAKGGFGLSTLGRKTIGGIDAARHGKGFKQGWNRTHGDLYNKFHKKLDEWAPDSAEARKNERLGREEIKMMNTKWTKGNEIRERLKSSGKDFGNLDGTDTVAYTKAGFKGEFLQSKMNLDKATEEQKILNRIYQARQMGTSLEEAIGQESTNIQKYKLDESRFNTDTKLYKEVDATNKKVSGMEKVHESMRKMNQDQAYIEDAIKFVKYNETDPTDPNRVSKGLSKGTSAPPTPNISFDDTPPTSDTSVMDRVNNITGVSRESATDNGATTSAIVESVVEDISKEIEAAKRVHDTTTDRDEMVKAARKIQELQRELEDIRRRNS